MLPKQDRIHPRTAKELEQKYNLGEAIESGRENYAGQQDQISRLTQSLSQFMAYTTGRFEELDNDSGTWFYSGIPTLKNQPAVQWTSEDLKIKHIGDMYYDNDTGKTYLFRCKEVEGENVFEWVKCFADHVGFKVTFHGSSNEIIAIYYVTEGTAVNPPSNSGTWKDSNGNAITFPYTPTGDIELFTV